MTSTQGRKEIGLRLPPDIYDQVRELAGPRGMNGFIVQAIREKLADPSKIPASLWVIVCPEGRGWEAEYEGLWGNESRVYRDRAAASAAAESLLESGDWGDSDPPEYSVQEWTLNDALADPNLRQDVIALLEGHPLADALADEVEALQEAETQRAYTAAALTTAGVYVPALLEEIQYALDGRRELFPPERLALDVRNVLDSLPIASSPWWQDEARRKEFCTAVQSAYARVCGTEGRGQ